MNTRTRRALTIAGLLLLAGCGGADRKGTSSSGSAEVTCSADGAPPFTTVPPVTVKPVCSEGSVLSFDQAGVTRYACLNLPAQAEREQASGARWPLLIYLHGSLVSAHSIYTFGKHLFELHKAYPLSSTPGVDGFLLLSPEGRKAEPWPSTQVQTGEGYHWDEWNRSPSRNLDALAIDHFVDEVVASGRVDPRRVYVFGWSNGAYMAALYGMWRSDRIAAIGQYAGADPWTRLPCPVTPQVERQAPLVLLRNLCDALVSCESTDTWIKTLTEQHWPFEYQSLDFLGGEAAPASACPASCDRVKGLAEHVRWPSEAVMKERLMPFLKQHPLPLP
jgi:predicted esterase